MKQPFEIKNIRNCPKFIGLVKVLNRPAKKLSGYR